MSLTTFLKWSIGSCTWQPSVSGREWKAWVLGFSSSSAFLLSRSVISLFTFGAFWVILRLLVTWTQVLSRLWQLVLFLYKYFKLRGTCKHREMRLLSTLTHPSCCGVQGLGLKQKSKWSWSNLPCAVLFTGSGCAAEPVRSLLQLSPKFAFCSVHLWRKAVVCVPLWTEERMRMWGEFSKNAVWRSRAATVWKKAVLLPP